MAFFSTRKFCTATKICGSLVTCQTTIVLTRKRIVGILSFIDQHFICLMPTGATNLIAVKILFFLVCRYENLGELCMHFELKSAASGPIWLELAKLFSDGLPTKP